MRKKFKIFGILIFTLFMTTGCELFKSDVMDDINIYTTIYPVNYLITYLYGDNSTIRSVYPSGSDVNNYELSDKKLNDYSKSDLFVFNSKDRDMDLAVDMVNRNSNLKLIDVALGMDYNYSIEELWLNPYNYLMMARNVKNGLNEYITSHYLIKNINEKFDDLQYRLSKLDAELKSIISNANYTTIVADNDLFKFLEKYNITVISLEEDIRSYTVKKDDTITDIALEYKVSADDIKQYNNLTSDTLTVGQKILIPIKTIEQSNIDMAKKLINNGDVKYIFSASTSSNEVVNNLIKDNDIELATFNIMKSIDGGVNGPNDSYFTIMNDNMEMLKMELQK